MKTPELLLAGAFTHVAAGVISHAIALTRSDLRERWFWLGVLFGPLWIAVSIWWPVIGQRLGRDNEG